MRPRLRALLLLLSGTLALGSAPPAAADLADETALAERFAPVVRQPYEPTDVELLFDEPTVAFRGPRTPTW